MNAIRSTKAELEARGHEILVVAPHRDDGPTGEDVLYCRAREFKGYPGYFMAFLPSRRELAVLGEYEPDLIHSHGLAFMGLKGMWAARELSRPMVLTFHTMVLDAVPHYVSPKRAPLYRRLIAFYLRMFLHRCGAVVAPTQAILQELEVLAPQMRKTAVVPNGVDTERFRPGAGGDVRERHELGDGPVLLYVGRVAPEKEVPFLLESFPAVRRRWPDARLLVVGTGPALAGCAEWVRRHELQDRIHLVGFVPDDELPAYYAASDVLAVASRFETQGLVALESMAVGTPPVTVDYRPFPEYVEEGVNGFLFPPGDAEAFVAAVGRALACDEEVRRNARRTAERYSWGRCTDRLLAVYRDMVDGVTPRDERG